MDTILVVVDQLTKQNHFLTLWHLFTTKDVTWVLLKEAISLDGLLHSMVSNQDRLFLSQFWVEIFKVASTTLKFSSTYHPQIESQTEVVNRSMEIYLYCFYFWQPWHWPKWLGWVEYWYNTSYHSSTRIKPFKALYGRNPIHYFGL